MKKIKTVFYILSLLMVMSSCAKMGSPDGGWYDETPPRVVGASPADKATNVHSKKVEIYFSEFIQVSDASEKVVVSPPQLEAPIISGQGKKIKVELQDSLKPNTTYTIDFSDAISDNNEGNPLGNYTYSFSTGDAIDTLEVSGYCLAAENLEPIKGILVGLYSNLSDTIFKKQPMLRVSRTDSRGRFVIKGIAPGNYRIYALQDADGNYIFNQKSEEIAFNHDVIVPSYKADVRQDTIWKDSLHIGNIQPVHYTHFLPDNIVLTAFTEAITNRYFIKADRTDANHFTLYFSYGDTRLPKITGLNFNANDAFVTESSAKNDTITYWLKDTALINQDTLRMAVDYQKSDSLGHLISQTDTLEVLPKLSFDRRQKLQEKAFEKWHKEQNKKKDKGDPYDSVMPPETLKPDIKVSSSMDPDNNIPISFDTPLAKIDTSFIHLYSEHDSLWYRAPFQLDKVGNRQYKLKGEWQPGVQYSLEMDSMAFRDIYGKVSGKYKQGFQIKALDEYSSLLVNVNGMSDSSIVVQLLDGSDKVVKEVSSNNGIAEFYYVNPGKYYMRMFVDRNKNGIWDTGDYDKNLEPESVYYYPDVVECKAKWDVNQNWNPLARPLYLQKPGAITKQKPEQDKKVKHQNAQRAKNLGIQYIPQE